VTPHPLEPALLLIHGVIAILAMYLFGWITAHHILRRWPARLRRVGGGTLGTFLLVLTVSGFALFLIGVDEWQHVAARIHDVLGLRDSTLVLCEAAGQGQVAGGGATGRSVLRQNPPVPSAFHAMGSQRTSAKANQRAHNNMAALYHHSDSDSTQGVGNSPAA
jgi:hypothetical protein